MTSPVTRPALMAVKPFALAIAIGAAFSSFSSFAIAQTSRDKVLEPVVVTATRSPQAARDVLTDNIVISSEEIAQSGQSALVDLLQKKRGIQITRNGGPGTASSVAIRGANNNQTLVLVDGVRTGSATSGGATWAAIPLSQIDRVEIVYGALSTLYGADAVGGVVQIFTKKGEGPPRLTAFAGAGSYGTRSLEAGISGATGGDRRFSYALSAAHERSDGFSATKPSAFQFNADEDGYEQNSASGQFALALAKGHELGFTFLHSRNESQFDDGASAFDARGIGRLESYALHSKNRVLSNWTSQLRLSRAADKADSLTSTGISTFNTVQNSLGWQNDVTMGTDLLQLVLERREEKTESTQAAVVGTRDTDSVAVSYLLKRGAHLASLGIRNDRNSQFGSHTSGSIGYGYHITQALRANAGAGTSFRAPTFNELYFPEYGLASNQPEKGRNAEIGLYYDDGKSQFSAAYYRNRITELIVSTWPCPVTPAAYPFGCAYNVNKALLTGLSLGAGTTLGSVTLRGSLDLQDPQDETTGRRLARRAKRHGTLSAGYGAGATQAGAEVVFSSQRFDDAANRNSLGGYGLLNLYASHDFAPNWSLFGRWNNVLDKDYELARNYATAGSNLFVGVRYGMR